MNEWFTPMDAINLMNNGYKLFEFEVNMFQELENEILFCRKGIIQQKEIPLENVWDIDFNLGTNVVDVYVNYLRKKIDKAGAQKLIHTAIGLGYVLKET